MIRTVMTMIAGLACITAAFAQISEERVPAKGFALFSVQDTFRPYEFARHAIGENDIQKETQEMQDYSVAHGIYPEVEIIKADAAEIDKAWRNVSDGKVKFRYVIDMNTLRK